MHQAWAVVTCFIFLPRLCLHYHDLNGFLPYVGESPVTETSADCIGGDLYISANFLYSQSCLPSHPVNCSVNSLLA